ncbi:MAG: hypothetical protein IE881_05765 [Epsilonproteobacteria bacterium]|nr:hypothetical protein [Campylobacterota bacterium]
MRKAVIFLVAVLANVNLTFANASSSVELNSPSKKELFEQKLLDEHKSLFEMLTILNMAKIKSQDKEIAQWKIRNQHLKYTDWTFDWIEEWAKTNNYQSKKKERINKTLGVLLSHIEAR